MKIEQNVKVGGEAFPSHVQAKLLSNENFFQWSNIVGTSGQFLKLFPVDLTQA